MFKLLFISLFISYTYYILIVSNEEGLTDIVQLTSNLSKAKLHNKSRTYSDNNIINDSTILKSEQNTTDSNILLGNKNEQNVQTILETSVNGSITIKSKEEMMISSIQQQNSHTAPNISSELPPLIKKHTVNNTIILYCTDNAYSDLFLNVYYASQLWKYKNLVVTCFDTLCYKKLSVLNVPLALINIENDPSVDLTKAAICHTKEFHHKAHYKLVLWKLALSMNVRILYVDSDVILLKDPFNYLNSITGYDIMGQKDGYLCSGFMYMYPTRNTKLAVNIAIKIRPTLNDADDQNSLIYGIRSIPGFKLLLLPSDIVPSGEVFFNSHSYYWDKINEKQLTIHNNYIHGLENKLYRFKEIKMYKLNRNNEYSDPSAKYLTIELWSSLTTISFYI